jgi:HK97 family phage major capsid protein
MGLDTTVEAVGSESQITITRNTGIVSTLRKRILKYLTGGVSVGSLVGQNKVMWVEELDEQGAPIFIGEGDAKTQLSVRYEERDKKARKIGVHGKVTTEMMRNLPSFINYIKNNLARRVDIKTEDQLFAGNDTGDNLAGLSGYATAFTGGSLAGTLPNPSVADVFRAIALQIEEAFGMGTAVYVRPSILAQMDTAKTTDGVYQLPPFRSANGNIVAGMTLISSNGIPAGLDFIGGDLSVVNVLFSDNMSIQIGLDGNDFINNKKTILVEQELVQFVSANDTQVLVKGTIATAITALTTP